MIQSKTKNLGIIEAIKELKEVSLTDRLRMEHEQRLKAKRDREAEDEFVYLQGKDEGIKIAEQKGIESFINAFRRNGYTDEQIAAELMTEYKIDREEALRLLR